MMVNDPIADLLTRIRNGRTARHETVSMPHSKQKEQVARILAEAGFLTDVKVQTSSVGFKTLDLGLPVDPEVITELVRVSKPGRRVYTSAKDIPLVLGGRG